MNWREGRKKKKDFIHSFLAFIPRHYCLSAGSAAQRLQIAAITPRMPSDGVIKVNVWHI